MFFDQNFQEMEKEYDIRNDEEQEKKCIEVLELLVTAGYFRARIKVSDFISNSEIRFYSSVFNGS